MRFPSPGFDGKKLAATTALALVLLSGLIAQPVKSGFGLTVDELLAVVPEAANKTPQELTIAERLAISGALSVARQEQAYLHHAAFASLMLPGAGQFLTGDVAGGLLHAGAQLALVGGGMAAMYYLTPAELRVYGLDRTERKALLASFVDSGRSAELLAPMGVSLGVALLTTANSLWAASGAYKKAQANLSSGKVSFEPVLGLTGKGMGFGLRHRW